MKTKKRLFKVYLLFICAICLMSCYENEDFELVDSSYKTWEVSCGYDFEVPVLANNWSIESVQEMPTGKNILDKNNNPMALVGNGKVEADNGWLALTRSKEDRFIINLKENFDKLNDRKFVICINQAGRRDYVTVNQKAGVEYKIVKSKYAEIEEQREIYVSDKECRNLTLFNNLSKPVWEPCGSVFQDVVHSSEFKCEDYGAFDWVSEHGVELLNVPDLMIDGYIRWSNNVTYKKGVITTPYIKDIPNGNKILMQPYTTTYLNGEMTYCKRICNYVFTIENVGTGTRFDVSGIWTQIEPIESHLILSDQREQ